MKQGFDAFSAGNQELALKHYAFENIRVKKATASRSEPAWHIKNGKRPCFAVPSRKPHVYMVTGAPNVAPLPINDFNVNNQPNSTINVCTTTLCGVREQPLGGVDYFSARLNYNFTKWTYINCAWLIILPPP